MKYRVKVTFKGGLWVYIWSQCFQLADIFGLGLEGHRLTGPVGSEEGRRKL